MKKTSAFLMFVVAFLMIFSSPIFAAEENFYAFNDDVVIIEASSEEEVLALLAEIEENNRRAQELWEAAVLRSEAEKETYEAYIAEIEMNPQIQSVPRIASISDNEMIQIALWSRFHHDATYSVTTVFGSPVISNVSNLRTLPANSNSSVNDRITTGQVIIDNGRVLAVHANMRVGVRNTSNGTWFFRSINRYMEYYTNHTGRVF
jgi:hypothetical protein